MNYKMNRIVIDNIFEYQRHIAELNTPSYYDNITKQELIDNYNNVKKTRKRQPRIYDINDDRVSKFPRIGYIVKWGSWSNFTKEMRKIRNER